MEWQQARFLSYEQVACIANEFLEKHNPDIVIPVNIEYIAESIGLDIVPVPGLKTAYDVDGFLTLDQQEIRVDQDIMMESEVRYRFTLAHELAHVILHGEAFQDLEIQTIDDWFIFHNQIDDEWFEKQANWFAGAVLVPKVPLIEAFENKLRTIKTVDAEALSLSNRSKTILASSIGDTFNVSATVVKIRLEKLGLY